MPRKKVYDEETEIKESEETTNVFPEMPDRNDDPEDEIIDEEDNTTEEVDESNDLIDEVLGAGDEKPDFELEPEENPHIDDFTSPNEGGVAPVTSIQVTEEDRLRVVVAQLQMQNLELESQVLEQKHTRKVEELNKLLSDYKDKYDVPAEWKLHAPSGTFNKGQ